MWDGPLHVIVLRIRQAMNGPLWACNSLSIDLYANTALLDVINLSGHLIALIFLDPGCLANSSALLANTSGKMRCLLSVILAIHPRDISTDWLYNQKLSNLLWSKIYWICKKVDFNCCEETVLSIRRGILRWVVYKFEVLSSFRRLGWSSGTSRWNLPESVSSEGLSLNKNISHWDA